MEALPTDCSTIPLGDTQGHHNAGEWGRSAENQRVA